MNFTTLQDAKNELDEFFRWPDRKVFMLKGPWGCGKSYFLRNIYIPERMPKNGGDSILPKNIAYTSALGCGNIQQLEEHIFGAVQNIQNWDKPLKVNFCKTVKETASNIKFAFFGFNLQIPFSAFFARYVRNSNLLIIIDDLERATLSLSDILLAVSAIAENSQNTIKIIVVCNVDKLQDVDKNKVAFLREKCLAQEVNFNPQPKEFIDKLFSGEVEKRAVQKGILIIREANVRILRLVAYALRRLEALFLDLGYQFDDNDKKDIIFVSIFYYRSSIAINGEWVSSHFRNENSDFFDLPSDANEDAKLELENYRPLLNRFEIHSHFFAEFIAEWLKNGNSTKEEIKAIVLRRTSERQNSEMENELELAKRPFSENFTETSIEKVAEPLIHFFEKYCESMPTEMFLSQLKIFKRYDVDTKAWQDRHVSKNIKSWSIVTCREHHMKFFSPASRAMIDDRIGQLNMKKTIKDTLWRIADNVRGQVVDFDFLAQCPIEDYLEWLKNDHDPDVIMRLREAIMVLRSPGAEPSLQGACVRLEEAIRRLASESKINELRADAFFNIQVEKPTIYQISS